MSVETDTLECVGPIWETARHVWSKVGAWGFTSVRHALTKLADEGKIEAKYAPHANGTIIVYRKNRR